jgi:hypothetical protein
LHPPPPTKPAKANKKSSSFPYKSQQQSFFFRRAFVVTQQRKTGSLRNTTAREFFAYILFNPITPSSLPHSGHYLIPFYTLYYKKERRVTICVQQ